MNNSFKPAWWLPGPHLQTLWAACLRRPIQLPIREERLELPDGDFLDLAWVGKATGPIVCVLHGLNGSVHSPYAQGILQAITQRGWRSVLIHFRGCSGVPNRLPRSYHAGETGDLAFVIDTLKQRSPNVPIAAIGYSLGGNVLLKWLGESGTDNPLRAAIAVSVPFDLAQSADRLNRGFSKIYQWKLLRTLNRIHRTHYKTFWAFDHAVTAPLHGFEGVDDYYAQSSSRQYLKTIERPTLILQALDDPFGTTSALPRFKELSEQVQLECTEGGGHVGFVAGSYPWKPRYWLEHRMIHYLEQQGL